MNHISKGECHITREDIIELQRTDRTKARVLQKIKSIHEDLAYSKNEIRDNLESEYKVKLLEKKNKELEQFNYIASHDMKEPINTISSYSEYLLDTYEDKLETEITQCLKFIKDSSQRLYKLVDGLLHFSLVNEHNNLENVDCNVILEEIVQDLNSTIKKNNAKIKIGSLPTIYADAIAINQLFQNLVNNALKYKHPDRDPVVKIKCKEEYENYLFSVKDNGLGIAEDYYAKIFNLLTRLHKRSDVEGAGIGLSTCKKIVENLGGKIWVDSVVDEGTTFFIEIPKRKAPEEDY